VVSTVALSWRFFLWVRSNPRVHVQATMKESPTGDSAEDWIEFKLRNRGGKPTTVEEIMLLLGNWICGGEGFMILRGFPGLVESVGSETQPRKTFQKGAPKNWSEKGLRKRLSEKGLRARS